MERMEFTIKVAQHLIDRDTQLSLGLSSYILSLSDTHRGTSVLHLPIHNITSLSDYTMTSIHRQNR